MQPGKSVNSIRNFRRDDNHFVGHRGSCRGIDVYRKSQKAAQKDIYRSCRITIGP